MVGTTTEIIWKLYGWNNSQLHCLFLNLLFAIAKERNVERIANVVESWNCTDLCKCNGDCDNVVYNDDTDTEESDTEENDDENRDDDGNDMFSFKQSNNCDL